MPTLKQAVRAAAFGIAAASICSTTAIGFASYFAVVDGDGETTRGSGVQSSARLLRGDFEVVFSRPVNACAFVASVNALAGGFVASHVDPGNPNRILVKTRGIDGARADRAFTIIVSCVP